jgi:hypothetical protein
MTEFDAAVMAAAAKLGMSKPALVYLHAQSEEARAIKAEIVQGKFPAKQWPSPSIGGVYLIAGQDAGRLFRRHCGASGAFVAAKIDGDDGSAWDYLNVGVLPGRVDVYAMRNSVENWYSFGGFAERA